MLALSVAVLEVLALLQATLQLQGAFWDGVAYIAANFAYVGYAIIVFFVLSTLGAMLVFKCYVGPRLEQQEAALEERRQERREKAAKEQAEQDDYLRKRVLAMAMAPPVCRLDDDFF